MSGAGSAVAEFGVVTMALLAIARDGVDDRALAMRICRACVDGLDVDGAAISLQTASVARQTLAVTAETAALMMLGLRTDPDQDGVGWLDHAVAHRAEIHQATGMVSVQLDVTAAEALARMRAHAFVHDRLLIEVAHDVVARRLVFSENME